MGHDDEDEDKIYDAGWGSGWISVKKLPGQ